MAKKRKVINQFQDEEKKLERTIFGLMPELPKFFERLAGRIEHFDGTEPRTFIAKMESDVQAFAEKIRGREKRVGRFLWFLLGKVVARAHVKRLFCEAIEHAKKAAAADGRYSLLLKLMHKTDEKIRFGSLFVSLVYANSKEMIVLRSLPMKLLQRAEETSGETRALIVLDALAKTAELLYKPYVQTVWSLSYIKEGKPLPEAPEFGDLVKVAQARLSDYPGIIEPDATWMRNSAVHNPPHYILEEDTLWMWDRSHPRTKVHVDDLLALVQRMYFISAITIQYVAQLYILRDFYLNTGLLDKFVECIPYAVSKDEKRLAAAEQEMKQYVGTLLAPLENYFEIQAKSSVKRKLKGGKRNQSPIKTSE